MINTFRQFDVTSGSYSIDIPSSSMIYMFTMDSHGDFQRNVELPWEYSFTLAKMSPSQTTWGS